MNDLCALLRARAYPGRGIVLGQTAGGAPAALYFIMGRSEQSRNRVFSETRDGIRTRLRDPSRADDPSLLLYHPARRLGRALIVANGDHCDTIRDYLEQGRSFEEALRTRSFEPDGPIWTPRIAGLLLPDGSCRLAILKRCAGGCTRQFFEYPACPGTGYFLHTYAGGDPPASFAGEPEAVAMPGDLAAAEAVWDSLHHGNRVALYACIGGETRIWNQYPEGEIICRP